MLTNQVVRRGSVTLGYTDEGDGDPVVLVMGTGSPGRVWRAHQVPALRAAGYRVITYDARGIGDRSSPAPPGLTIEDLVADLAGLVEHLDAGPARVVGTSLGARVVQELALARPELVARAVAMAGHARLDPVQRTLTRGQQDLFDAGVRLPARYLAAVRSALNLSPATLRDEVRVADWLEVFEVTAAPAGPGERAQLAVSDALDDRRAAYRDIRVPLLVIGFADDLMIPAYLSREVADAVPGARYVEIPDAGHLGYLERPDVVNAALLDFLNGPA